MTRVRTQSFRRIFTGVERGYLVYAGQPLGLDLEERPIELDTDVVILDVQRMDGAWHVRYLPVDVRPRVGPAA